MTQVQEPHPRAAIYLRISLDATGEHLAVERQREDCVALAQERGWDIVHEYVDNSVSASKRDVKRPAYDQMVQDFDAGLFDALVCWDLDRLTRQPRQLEDWIDRAETSGLVVVTANGEADLGTDAGRLFARIKASVARAEVERMSARRVRAARQRSEKGRPPVGVRLTGYETDGRVREDEAQVIRHIFRLFLTGGTLRSIVADLNERGVKTRRGGRWDPSSVRGALTNPRYAGLAVYRGKPTGGRGNWTPLVSEDEWRQVQAILNDPRRKTSRVGYDRKYLGSNIYRCGECGHALRAWSARRYYCPECGISRSAQPIDDLVVEYVHQLLADPRVIARLAEDDSGQVAALTRDVDRLTARMEAVGGDYDAGLIDGHRYSEATAKLRAELEPVLTRRARLLARDSTSALVDAPDPARMFDESALAQRRAIVSAILDVRVMRGPKGRKPFDPATVMVQVKGADHE